MCVNPLVFKMYDIRGEYGADLDPELFENIGKALGSKYPGKFTVGGDIRVSTPTLKTALIKGLTGTGCEVVDVGITSFGETMFAAWKEESVLACFVTASHLPPKYNGMKPAYGDGDGFPPEQIQQIRKDIEAQNFKQGKGMVLEKNYRDSYINFMKEKFSADKKVVVDCGNGPTAFVAEKVFREVGCEPIMLFDNMDPNYPGRGSEPKDENITALKEKVVEESADFGVAFDGDGDRGVIVDDKGRMLTASQLGVIISKDLLKRRKGKVLANIECSMLVENVLGAENVERFPVGHNYMTHLAKKRNAVIGIEFSGHMVFPDYYLADDAMLIPLLLAEVLSKSGEKLSDLVDALPKYFIGRQTFKCDDAKKFVVVEALQKKFSEDYEKVNTMDGVRVDLGNGWMLLRASNTGASIRITVEAKSDEERQKIVEKFSAELEKAIAEC